MQCCFPLWSFLPLYKSRRGVFHTFSCPFALFWGDFSQLVILLEPVGPSGFFVFCMPPRVVLEKPFLDIYLDRPIYNMNNSNSNTNTSLSYSNIKNSTKANRYILINNGSGFERFISSLAIRIALLDMSNLPKINFLAIDEGFSAFDTHNINNVGQILDYLKTKFDFILTISHLTQIKENSDIIIGLQKDKNGYTKIIQ